ncbi:Mevalonyl-coenzyme A hydratase sidH [Psilocybe cubensis]|uniref:Enoyl-CoA hydratase n=2 Tax=Psilocybe cubensis TaxID=181762 RepID=A0A8H7Y4F2_PSICU|nr:Mevalonyl-coenzyme A hydratase sidH [Psilocybe cubensis]KAH9486144.1 Mevalonyl-coenzyme A hydratase sidH [Psilocybe cubensis]
MPTKPSPTVTRKQKLQPPAHSHEINVSILENNRVLLVSFNRPKALNAMTPQMADDLKRVLDWFEEEPELWVVIVTGEGRLFCAGADLKAWNTDQQNGKTSEQEGVIALVHGFGSISRRQSNKPIIAAVNGGAYGGGLEMVLNCDIVLASEGAKFALPEVKRGVVAIQGGIPRLAQIAGHQLASELLLLGKTIDASEAQSRFGFVNKIVPPSELIPAAIDIAQQIIANSPDAVQSTKHGLLLAQHMNVSESFLTHTWSAHSKRVYKGDNIKEGLKAFAEKRTPVWTSPKL